jgi:hypothetical protein
VRGGGVDVVECVAVAVVVAVAAWQWRGWTEELIAVILSGRNVGIG